MILIEIIMGTESNAQTGGCSGGDMDEGLTRFCTCPTACDELAQFLLICNHHCLTSGFVLLKQLSFYTNRCLLNQLMRLKRSFIIGNCNWNHQSTTLAYRY